MSVKTIKENIETTTISFKSKYATILAIQITANEIKSSVIKKTNSFVLKKKKKIDNFK